MEESSCLFSGNQAHAKNVTNTAKVNNATKQKYLNSIDVASATICFNPDPVIDLSIGNVHVLVAKTFHHWIFIN